MLWMRVISMASIMVLGGRVVVNWCASSDVVAPAGLSR
jgi:hypothetical protein